jgi:hypothetical protein
MSMKSGKYYFEYTRVQSSNDTRFGIIRDDKFISGGNVGLSASEYGYHVISTGTLSVDGTTTSSWITAFSQGDVGMIAYDADTGKVWFGRNGTWGGSGDPAAGTNPAATVNSFATYGYTAWVRVIGGGSPTIEKGAINFGQRPFTYTPPTGFKSLNTFNLPEPTIKQPNKYFDAVIWTGDQTNKQIPLNFTADFVWAKRRNNSDNHVLYDAIRGVNIGLNSNNTDPESTNNYGLDFDNGNYLDINGSQYFGGGGGSGITFVAWNWNAGGSTVTNTTGTISAQVRANPTAGFSIVTYTGNNTSNQTVGHGLETTPTFFILKSRGTQIWNVYSLAGGVTGNKILQLQTTDEAVTGTNINLTANPTTIGFGSASQVNGSGVNFVAYCFAPITGYSAFGSYTGNGSSDGTFVYTGFRPRFVLYKSSTSASVGDWRIHDTSRSLYNAAQLEIYPQSGAGEPTSSNAQADILSNGFKLRGVSGNTSWNESGVTYIYAAFAEMPFKYARAR